MVFSSLIFLFRFLPSALIIYFISPKKIKNLSLLLISIIFYFLSEPTYFFIIFLSIFINYFLSLAIERYRYKKCLPKIFLYFSICFNLGILFLFKYINFFIYNINFILVCNIGILEKNIPLGISFYTFQTLTYTVDVFKRKIEPERSIINFALYVSLFPQLIAGPIIKYSDINKELKERKLSLDNIECGIELFIIGLTSKVFIANNMGKLYEEILNIGFSNVSMILAWLGILSFALQIYFDFLGYSLMAIGLGKIFGFSFTKNFNHPYISRSISEFWRRWHITLGSFFKEYVYIPLGGNRVKGYKLFRNLFIVWTLTGFWHGASFNFIFWGLYFFTLIALEKLFLKDFLNNHIIFSYIYTIILILVGWAIFVSEDLNTLKEIFSSLFSFKFNLDFIYYILNYKFILILSIILCTPVLNKFYEKIKSYAYIQSITLIFCFLVCVAYLIDETYNPFLYFKF